MSAPEYTDPANPTPEFAPAFVAPEVQPGPELGGGLELPAAPDNYNQQNKLAAALYFKKPEILGGKLDNTYDYRNAFMDLVNKGSVTDAEVSAVLVTIRAPFNGEGGEVDEQRVSQIMQNISANKQILGILASFSGNRDFNRRDSLGPSDLREFIDNYPDPLQFDAAAQELIGRLHPGDGNDTAKQQQYELSLNYFMEKVYGKLHEYYQQWRNLKAKAAKKDGPKVIWSPNDLEQQEASPERNERLVEYAASAQLDKYAVAYPRYISGAMAPEELKEYEARNGHNQDAVVCDPNRGIFAVFDGAGGYAGGEKASKIAKACVENFDFTADDDPRNGIWRCLDQASRAMRDDPEAGYSTAVLAQVVERPDGGKRLDYGAAGDSRIYILRGEHGAVQITQDEGEGDKLTNALGTPDTRFSQLNSVDLYPGDVVVLCSDGVTGDSGTDLVSPQELTHWLKNSAPGDEANTLVRNGRKLDDRSAVVFRV
ncbi:MAG: protein phosphatase 2C domain-containing protein [Candidatus Nomurabacteria bacterium]|jgi:serine/threonine-protein phosphatase Stp1|nr:protein phosphatase 2C domain-containing protein [Candidatus Nomurabacteria bacterium]